MYGHIWAHIGLDTNIYGHIWAHAHTWSYTTIYGHIWFIYGHVWGHIWSYMIIYGPPICGHIWTSLSRVASYYSRISAFKPLFLCDILHNADVYFVKYLVHVIIRLNWYSYSTSCWRTQKKKWVLRWSTFFSIQGKNVFNIFKCRMFVKWVHYTVPAESLESPPAKPVLGTYLR